MPLPALPPSLPGTIQDLPPKEAHLCLRIKQNIEQLLHLDLRHSRLVVAFSGGADSLALLLVLHYLAPQWDIELTAAHLDHGIRPTSAREADWCKEYCRMLRIDYRQERADVPLLQKKAGCGLEEAARQARYAFLQATRSAVQAQWIAAGHHKNDLAEDILMRLIRGSGWPGLGGMPGVCRKRKLIRPLLFTGREEIETFLSNLGTSWLTDESNADSTYLRNRIRSQLLPAVLNENPAFLDVAANMWQLAQIDNRLFTALLQEKIGQAVLCESTEHKDGLKQKKDKTPPDEAQTPSVPLNFTSATDGTDSSDTDNSEETNEETEDSSPLAAVIAGRSLHREHVRYLPPALRLRVYRQWINEHAPGHIPMQSLMALDKSWHGKQFPKTIRFSGGRKVLVTQRALTLV